MPATEAKTRARDANPEKALPGWPPVVVAGVYHTGVNLMRDLIRRGVAAYGVDHNLNQPGFRSIYGKTAQCPNPDLQPDEWLDFMRGLARKLGAKPVLIASADIFISAIARHRDGLKDHYLFCYETAELQGKLATKEEQCKLVLNYGMPAPLMRFVGSLDEVRQFSADCRFPCLLKPLRSRDWDAFPAGHPLHQKKAILAGGPAELERLYRRAAEINPEVMAQENIEGPDTAKMVYLSCYDRSGRRIAVCMATELRSSPPHFGSASVVEPMWDDGVAQDCDRFLQAMGYQGLCEIELKRDGRDGKAKIIEANPRYTGTSDFAPYAGVDLGWLHYLDLIGRPVAPPVRQSGRNFRHIVLTWDFASFGTYRREGLLTWKGLLRSYRPPVKFFDFDLRDWRVSARTLNRLARLLLGPTLRKWFPKAPGPG